MPEAALLIRSQRPAAGIPAILAAAAVLISVAGWARADEPMETVQASHGAYFVDCHFWIQASSADVWNVLTDYDRLSDFVPSMRRSRVIQHSGETFVLDQEASARFMGIFTPSVKVQLLVREDRSAQIYFNDLSHDTFTDYQGQWLIEPSFCGGSWVHYHLIAKPKSAAARLVARRSFQKMAQELMSSVRREIQRRSQPVVCRCPCGA